MPNALAEMTASAKPAIAGGRPVRSSFLVYGRPDIREPEIREVVKTLKSGWIGTGPKTARFEEKFRDYTGSPHAIAVNSCTAALHLSLLAAGVGPGDEVITTPMTFCATLNAILHTGATPVFADCDKRTMNIDPSRVEAAITPRTKAVVPVHFAGRPCDMGALTGIARRRRLMIIEDCAHAIETEYKGRKAGTFGEAGCFSFYVTKNVVTAEGGMVVTPHGDWEKRIKMFALHGMSRDAWKRFSDSGYKHYGVEAAGFKYNMTDLQASLGLHQLDRVEKNWARRRRIWARYNKAFRNLPCATPPEPEAGTRHAFHLYTILIEPGRLKAGRDELLQAFIRENIGVGVHYLALNRHEFYRRAVKNGRESFPNAEYISDRTLSLPLSPALSDRDAGDVIAAAVKILEHYKR